MSRKIKKIVTFITIIMFSIFLFVPIGVKADTKFNLSASSIDGENYTHLNWDSLGADYSYVVYEKSEKDAEYQSIPSNDTVKTLNIYPDRDMLQKWFSDEHINDVKIDSVSLSSFNANPSKYLRKVNGKWNYNSVFYSIWNGWAMTVYPNDAAVEYLRSYIKDGGGFMTSHHTIGYVGLDRGINKLAKEMGVELFSTQPRSVHEAYAGRDENGNLFDSVSFEELKNNGVDDSPYWASGNRTKIVKNGLIMNYPYEVGKAGDILTVPITGELGVFGKGDVWMNFASPTGGFGEPFEELIKSPATGEKGTNNFFLHTYKNTAIMSSGHKLPLSTAEIKLIANTLYYVAQITDGNKCNDHKAQDITAPTAPSIYDVKVNDNKINIDFSKAEDRGTKYEYYVKAKNNINNTEVTSEKESATVTSGIKGYSILIDQNPTTVPDGKITTTSTAYSVDNTLGRCFYVHVAAVDNNGNMSEVSTYKYNDSSVFDLKPSAYKFNVGDEVNIKLIMNNLCDIKSECIKIKFDSSKLKFIRTEFESNVSIRKNKLSGDELEVTLLNKFDKNDALRQTLLNMKFRAINTGSVLLNINNAQIHFGKTGVRGLESYECGGDTVFIAN